MKIKWIRKPEKNEWLIAIQKTNQGSFSKTISTN